MTLVGPAIRLVEEHLELAGDLLDALPALLHAPPCPSDTPALCTGLGGLIEGVELELIPVMKDDDDVDEAVEARLPGCDSRLCVGGRIGEEVRRGEADGTSEDGLVYRSGLAGHPAEHVDHKLGEVSRLCVVKVRKRETAFGGRDGLAYLYSWKAERRTRKDP